MWISCKLAGVNAAWGYLLGAAVTGLSLLFNQWRSDRRDHLRLLHEQAQAEDHWKKSRAEERERWAREDARRWVAERRQASAEVLNKLEPWLRHLRQWSQPWPLLTPEELEVERQELRRFPWQEASSEVGAAWAVLEILASDQVREAYRSLLAQMYAAQAIVIGLIEQDEVDRQVAAIEERFDCLLHAIRDDLGVQGVSAIDADVTQRHELPSGPSNTTTELTAGE